MSSFSRHYNTFRPLQPSLFKSLKPSGNYMYRKFNIDKIYVLPTQLIYVFWVDLRTNSDYFPIQH